MDSQEIIESFDYFDDWEDKYRFIIDLGKSLPHLAESEKADEFLVRGCQSQVWLQAGFDSASNKVSLKIDSDAHIVRGLIAIVLSVYDNRTPAEILEFDIEALFEELALLKHLSPTRGNGLRAMIGRIRDLATSQG
jgi:cysteine desulfuration protein SufE